MLQIWTRATVGLGIAVTVAGATGWLELRSSEGGAPSMAVEPIVDSDVQNIDVSSQEAPPEEPRIVVVADEGTWLPKGYAEKTSAEDTDELASIVENWLEEGATGDRPKISYKRGLTYVESAEDRGDDGPYPRSANAEAIHACGSQAVWLRAQIREELMNAYLECHGNICSYGGMEYAPSGDLVFHKHVDAEAGDSWELVAWVQTYEAALPDSIANGNRRDNFAALTRLRTATCAGEPDGQYY